MTHLQQFRRSRLLRIVAVTLVVVAAFDLTIGLAGPFLPRPLSWYSYWAQAKDEEMSQIQHRDENVDVAFVGSSVVIAAFNPEVFTESTMCGAEAYNGAIAGAQITGLDHWTNTVVVPALNPSTVVIGVTSRDMSGGAGFTNAYFSSAAVRDDLGGRFDRTVAGFSNLALYRSVLRDPQRWKSKLDALLGITTESWNAAVLGWHTSSPEAGYSTATYRQRETDLVVGNAEIDALEAFVDELLDAGIHVVIADMAVSADYEHLQHPSGTYSDYQAEVRKLAERTGVEYVDLTQFDDRKLFVDPVHVNTEGSDVATRKLATEIGDSTCEAKVN